MDNEAYRDLTHNQARDFVAAMLMTYGGDVRTEHRLPNRRVADVAWLDPHGDLQLYEVKAEYKASLGKEAYDKYYTFANFLWLVIPNFSPATWNRHREQHRLDARANRVGILGIHNYRAQVYFPPREHKIIGEHRLLMLQSLCPS